MKMSKGIAPIVIILLVALGLVGGSTAGYTFREQIKQTIQGKTTADEIKEAVDAAKNTFTQGQDKFELEGIATSVDATNNVLTVKIKSSTASIKELRLSETPIALSATVAIQNGEQKNLKIADVPIDSQVHVGGTISDGKLTATKIEVQKENGLEKQGDNFSFGGTVKEVGSGTLVLTVKTANAKVKDQKGQDVTVKITSSTIIEKGSSVIALSDIKAGDEVQATGLIVDKAYEASKIEVKIKEQAGELEQEQEANAGTNTNIENENQNENSGTGSTNSSSNSSSNGNSKK